MPEIAIADGRPLCPEAFDSATRAVRATAEALTGHGRGILEAYPPGAALFLGFLRLLPEGLRIALLEWGIGLSLGRSPERFDFTKVATLPEWCVRQYPHRSRRYKAVLIGAPSGAAAHLAALLEAPFLTNSFLLGFRYRQRLAPDDVQGYAFFGHGLSQRVLTADKNEIFEAVNHFDPLHDRSLVKFADLLRLRLVRLPEAYRKFILENLAPEGQLILLNCTYPWKQYRFAEREYLQVGGLGGVSSEEFLARWPLGSEAELVERPESEWGCPPGFAEAVRRFAKAEGFRLLELRFDHPERLSLLAYQAYCAAGAREEEVMLDCFTYSSPCTNVITGIPALWLPFNAHDSLKFARRFLEGKRFARIYLALVPSFARCPDTVPFHEWRELLSAHGQLELLGIDPRAYPADPLAPFAFTNALERLRRSYRPRPRLGLSLTQLEELARRSGLIPRLDSAR